MHLIVAFLFICICKSSSFIAPRTKAPMERGLAAMEATDTRTTMPTVSGKNVEDMFDDSPEEAQDTMLRVDGQRLPAFLRGTLIRNGPGLFGAERRRFDHCFDGLAKLTRYHFDGEGSVTFSAKFLRTSMYQAFMETGDIPPGPYTGPVSPTFTTFQKITGAVMSTSTFDNVPVNIHQIGDRSGPWVGVTDAPVQIEFDPTTLATKGKIKSPDGIVSPGGVEIFSTAHPHAQDGCTYNLFTELRPIPLPFYPKGNLLHVVRTDRDLRRTVVGSVGTAGTPEEVGRSDVVPYLHDFSLTEHYAVVCVWPLRMDLTASGTSDRGVMREMKWAADTVNTMIYVFDIRPSGPGPNKGSLDPVAVYEAPPMFAYHHINAYEEVGRDAAGGETTRIVMDISGYGTPDIVNSEYAFAFIHNMKDPALRKNQVRDARYYRFDLPLPATPNTVPIATTPCVLTALTKEGKRHTAELVTVNPTRRGRRYRYSYGFTAFAGADDETSWGDDLWGIVKMDHTQAAAAAAAESSSAASASSSAAAATASATTWVCANCYPSEPIFVPRPGATDEDDGVLLSQVYDGGKRESFLLVLDARDMTEMSRCYTGMRCPISFHGQFIPYDLKKE